MTTHNINQPDNRYRKEKSYQLLKKHHNPKIKLHKPLSTPAREILIYVWLIQADGNLVIHFDAHSQSQQEGNYNYFVHHQ